jgi:transcriptional regulator
MRHLILIGLLAGAAMACQDTAAPRESGSPALSEASDRAHLDLHVERASLIAAGNALSSAIAGQGVAAGLNGAFADDVLFLSPRVNVLSYSQAVRAQRSHEHLVAILRELSVTPQSELERLRAPAMPLRFADLEVDTATREVRRAGEPVALRPKEYDLLVALMRRQGELVTRRELLAEVWGYSDDVSSRTVDTHVAVLRRKLGHGAADAGYITNVAKAGYRMLG